MSLVPQKAGLPSPETRGAKKKQLIASVRDESGVEQFYKDDIAEVFVRFYENLFKGRDRADTINNGERTGAQQLTTEEIDEALKVMNCVKCKDQSGIVAEMLKASSNRFRGNVLDLFNDVLDPGAAIPETWKKTRTGQCYGFLAESVPDLLRNLRVADHVLLLAQSEADVVKMLRDLKDEAAKYGRLWLLNLVAAHHRRAWRLARPHCGLNVLSTGSAALAHIALIFLAIAMACAICLRGLEPGDSWSLLRGHAYHKDCISQEFDRRRLTHVMDLPCPQCGQTGRDMEAAADGLLTEEEDADVGLARDRSRSPGPRSAARPKRAPAPRGSSARGAFRIPNTQGEGHRVIRARRQPARIADPPVDAGPGPAPGAAGASAGSPPPRRGRDEGDDGAPIPALRGAVVAAGSPPTQRGGEADVIGRRAWLTCSPAHRGRTCSPGSAAADALADVLRDIAALARALPDGPCHPWSAGERCLRVEEIVPAAARNHLLETRAAGCEHALRPRWKSEAKLQHILDTPLPRQFDMRRWRCAQCKVSFSVGPSDVLDARPSALRCADPRRPACGFYFAQPFLVMVLQKFMEVLNLRAVRRSLFEYHSNNALALVGGARSLWFVEAIPGNRVLRHCICLALESYLPDEVARMQRGVHVHSGAAVKGDGKRGRRSTATARRPFTKPVVALETEDWPDLKAPRVDLPWAIYQAGLGGLLDLTAANRSSAGLPPRAVAPASHSTDVYERHRKLLRSLRHSKFPPLRFQVHGDTPKGQARACSLAAAHGPGAVVTGEPVHSLFEVRRPAPANANDAEVFLADYKDAITRLSAATLPPKGDGVGQPQGLEPEAETLLERFVSQLPPTFQREAALDPVNMERARTFLAQPRCARAGTWKRVFGSLPPSWRRLDSSASRCNYRTEKAFNAELRRVQRWYRPGRRQRRWRTGIVRDRRQAVTVKGARSVITQKVRDHFRRMRRRVKVEGLMNWRDAALAARQAGIPVQSGTAPVERLWSCLEDMVPSAARGVSLRWFRVLSMAMFLRYNYTHFNKDNLPTMAERDPLLGQRLATIAMLARAVNDRFAVPQLQLRALAEPRGEEEWPVNPWQPQADAHIRQLQAVHVVATQLSGKGGVQGAPLVVGLPALYCGGVAGSLPASPLPSPVPFCEPGGAAPGGGPRVAWPASVPGGVCPASASGPASPPAAPDEAEEAEAERQLRGRVAELEGQVAFLEERADERERELEDAPPPGQATQGSQQAPMVEVDELRRHNNFLSVLVSRYEKKTMDLEQEMATLTIAIRDSRGSGSGAPGGAARSDAAAQTDEGYFAGRDRGLQAKLQAQLEAAQDAVAARGLELAAARAENAELHRRARGVAERVASEEQALRGSLEERVERCEEEASWRRAEAEHMAELRREAEARGQREAAAASKRLFAVRAEGVMELAALRAEATARHSELGEALEEASALREAAASAEERLEVASCEGRRVRAAASAEGLGGASAVPARSWERSYCLAREEMDTSVYPPEELAGQYALRMPIPATVLGNVHLLIRDVQLRYIRAELEFTRTPWDTVLFELRGPDGEPAVLRVWLDGVDVKIPNSKVGLGLDFLSSFVNMNSFPAALELTMSGELELNEHDSWVLVRSSEKHSMRLKLDKEGRLTNLVNKALALAGGIGEVLYHQVWPHISSEP
ncbi:unnamed protein product [Prorocentrum cordatum]|uniref:RING-type E3 ubiquitin transferase n=1 Tax=Prorocentrum cordatum TaxID=2364126 RepID=A0ABN9T5E9_9DINO|nr:unnamed protein product [Polarella glacialis]